LFCFLISARPRLDIGFEMCQSYGTDLPLGT
jgi:hypothetical protein